MNLGSGYDSTLRVAGTGELEHWECFNWVDGEYGVVLTSLFAT